ncbi:MAG: ABC transporter ATP-binding protein/permease [Candidatus Bathyarchaeota archaeon]|nr:ABC transporter ATP-binding protein/permease [Candidatus Bathyarchaeota archaeon]
MGFHGHRHWHRRGEEDDYERQVSDRELAVRLLRYTWRVKNRGLLMGLVVISNTILGLIPPYLFSLAIDNYITALNPVGLTMLAIAYVAVSLATYVANYGRRYLISWLGSRLEYDMRLDLFRHLQRLSLGYFAKKEVGSIVSRATNDIDKVMELVASGVVEAVADVVTLVGIVFIMLWMSPRLSLISFSIVPVIVFFAYFWGRRVRRVYRETRKTIASVSAKIEESVSGMKEIHAFSRERETRREFQEVNVSNLQANVEAGRVMSAFQPAVSLFSAVGNFLVLWFGGNAVINGTLTIGVLFAFMSYIGRFFWPIESLSQFWNQVQSAMAAAERVFHIMDTEIEVSEKPDALELTQIEGRITYEDMTFSYEEGLPVLQDINLEIEPNTTVALVGPTGAGKTTMINLLYRFYDPQEGRITIDGRDLRDLNIESMRSHMAIVLQDPILFSGTVKENIKYGNLEATDERVVEIAKAVGAHDFIMKLPSGYDTEVRERGSRLSMGQRQLISLARALIADPRILIMDEATSSIDAYTELIIKQAMEKVLRGRTSIVIAHRLSTVRKADKIVVLDEGRMVEMGTHRKLLRKEGLYRELYEMQFKYEPPVEAMVAPGIVAVAKDDDEDGKNSS